MAFAVDLSSEVMDLYWVIWPISEPACLNQKVQNIKCNIWKSYIWKTLKDLITPPFQRGINFPLSKELFHLPVLKSVFGMLLHLFMIKMDSSSTLWEGPCAPFFPLLASLYIFLRCHSEKKKKRTCGIWSDWSGSEPWVGHSTEILPH